MKLPAHAALGVGLVWTTGVLVAAYTLGLVLPGGGGGLNPFVDRGLWMLTTWVQAAVCWLAVSRTGRRRWEILLAAGAVTSLAGGNTFYVMVAGTEPPQFPSVGDLGYLMFYPPMLAACSATTRAMSTAPFSRVTAFGRPSEQAEWTSGASRPAATEAPLREG